jgi:hypothetical protein
MQRLHAAHATQAALSLEEHAERNALIQAEIVASGERAQAMARELGL